jgi:multisite-specific tRNA:(cytosine-C5)-methyltransferase
LYPHDQDTGGFFVAVLEKDPLSGDDAASSERNQTDSLKADSAAPSKRKSDDRSSSPSAEPDTKRVRADPSLEADALSDAELDKSSGKGIYKEEPYSYISPDDEEFKAVA